LAALPNDEKDDTERSEDVCCKIGGHLPKKCCIFGLLSQATYHINRDPLALKDPRGRPCQEKLGCKIPRTQIISFPQSGNAIGLDLWMKAENSAVIGAAGQRVGQLALLMGWWSHFFVSNTKKYNPLNGITIDYNEDPTIKGKLRLGENYVECIFQTKEMLQHNSDVLRDYWCFDKRKKFLYRCRGLYHWRKWKL